MKIKFKNYGVSLIVFIIFCICSLAIAHGWKAPKEEALIQNPIKMSHKSISKGKALYDQFCSYCHGDNAQGGVGLNLDMKMIPPNLKNRLKGHSEGDFFWKIKKGKGDMPTFQEDMADEEIWQTITYIKSLIVN
jgi:mono/diheme cytochrome c family protein